MWFEQVPGFNFQVHRIDTRFGPCGALEGVARLSSPWPEHAMLRLSLENYNRLRLHFYHGLAGVTLVYYEDQNYRWAAYATTRDAGKPLPKTWAITGTDDDRCRRTELRQGGPIDISYAAGELILSRGDIVLTSAPLAGPPTEVYFEGRAAFEGIALARATGVPKLLPENPVVLDIAKPAELAWQPSKPDLARIEKLPGGGVRFVADKSKERVHLFAPLAFETPREVVFELDDISPGAGVHFVFEDAKVHEVVRFFHDRTRWAARRATSRLGRRVASRPTPCERAVHGFGSDEMLGQAALWLRQHAVVALERRRALGSARDGPRRLAAAADGHWHSACGQPAGYARDTSPGFGPRACRPGLPGSTGAAHQGRRGDQSQFAWRMGRASRRPKAQRHQHACLAARLCGSFARCGDAPRPGISGAGGHARRHGGPQPAAGSATRRARRRHAHVLGPAR